MTTKLNCFHFYWMLQTGMMKQEQRRGDLLNVCQRRRGIRPLLRLPADSASAGRSASPLRGRGACVI